MRRSAFVTYPVFRSVPLAAMQFWRGQWTLALGRVLVSACLCLSLPSAVVAAERAVELELVLAADASGSIDITEAALQRRGYARAFRHPDVVAAIEGTGLGRIAVTYIEWAGMKNQRTLIDWTEIADAETAAAFADAIEQPSERVKDGTSISGAIAFGATRFAGNGFRGERHIIDISGDGPNNIGVNVTEARDRALATGIVINGLPIINDGSDPIGFAALTNLDLYYEDCVIGGPGAFIVVAEGFEDFARAIRNKLVLEIAGLAPRGPAFRLAAERSRPSCDSDEWQLRG